MSIAAKCTCEKRSGGYCIGGEGCKWHNYEPNKYWIDKLKELENQLQQGIERERELIDGLRKIDAISFHKNEWKEMMEIGNIVKRLLNK